METETTQNDVNMNDVDETRVIFSRKGQSQAKQNGYTNGDLGHHNNHDLDPHNNRDDWEREYYSDEDDIYLDGLHSDKASKPLMHPRHRPKVIGRTPGCQGRSRMRTILCFLVLVVSLSILMGLVVYFYNKKQSSFIFRNKPGIPINTHSNIRTKPETKQTITGCDDIEVHDVWVQGFPKLITESAIRLVDVNQDGVLDIIMGFGTGADGYYLPNVVCDIYFNGEHPCFGGLLALDGATGRELWRHYGPHELFGVNCNADLNKDGVNDCLAGGRANAFQAVSGKDGSILWNFAYENDADEIMNMYTPQITRDLDGDGVVDVLAVHGGDPLQPPGSKYRLSARIIIFSGRTGTILQRMSVPDYHESYYSPQIYTLPDGTDMVLYGTGGETHSGSLWVVSLDNLYKGNIKSSRAIYTDPHKGIMTPPVLLDITGDGIEDIVMAMFNSTVLAINGLTFEYLWNTSFPMSESYNTPAAGYFNEDDIPDFMVKYANGPGFPIYYNSQTNIIDGASGKPILRDPVLDTIGAQSSPLTVSMEGSGNDIFLYWVSDCLLNNAEGFQYKFIKGTNIHEQSRADFCKIRFKSKGYSKMFAISRNIKQPGSTIYYSSERQPVEHSKWINTTQEAMNYVKLHPEVYQNFLDYQEVSQKAEMERPENKYKISEDIEQFGNPIHSEVPFDDVANYGTISSKKGALLNTNIPSSRRARLRINGNRNTGNSDYNAGLSDVIQNVLDDGEYNDLNDDRVLPQRQFNTHAYSDYPNYSPNTQVYRSRNGGRNPNNRQQDNQDMRRRKPQVVKKEFMRRHLVKRNLGINYSTHHNKHNGVYNHIHLKGKKITKHYSKTKNKDKRKHYTSQNNKHLKQKKITKNKTKTKQKHKRTTDKPFQNNLKGSERQRRHIGPHDQEGLQRLLSTGTLAPTTLYKSHPDFNHSIDVIFATYWFFPAKTQVLLKADQDCVDQSLQNENVRFSPTSKYYGMDHDKFEHVVTQECLQASGHTGTDDDDHHTFQSMTTFNPYNLHMGQMTVYRLRLTCKCKNTDNNNNTAGSGSTRCSRVLPFDQQQWTSYMGRHGDSHFLPRRKS